ncbi:MAG: hypothetical protein GAK31_02693 [Stenotrophomonas maltophilia]|uniref:Uncharacterized protein n=1 Tax=Stenotrophomonas maltophilia TaxID=40324 RepID=A0A7V8FGQ1_STEMA|nr:MAG: hypothetical protein GAK31_02693 [Stenotrophomonas maltophilia]
MAWLRGAAGVSTVAACLADEQELRASLSPSLRLGDHERARIDALLPPAAVLAKIAPVAKELDAWRDPIPSTGVPG